MTKRYRPLAKQIETVRRKIAYRESTLTAMQREIESLKDELELLLLQDPGPGFYWDEDKEEWVPDGT